MGEEMNNSYFISKCNIIVIIFVVPFFLLLIFWISLIMFLTITVTPCLQIWFLSLQKLKTVKVNLMNIKLLSFVLALIFMPKPCYCQQQCSGCCFMWSVWWSYVLFRWVCSTEAQRMCFREPIHLSRVVKLLQKSQPEL